MIVHREKWKCTKIRFSTTVKCSKATYVQLNSIINTERDEKELERKKYRAGEINFTLNNILWLVQYHNFISTENTGVSFIHSVNKDWGNTIIISRELQIGIIQRVPSAHCSAVSYTYKFPSWLRCTYRFLCPLFLVLASVTARRGLSSNAMWFVILVRFVIFLRIGR